MSLKKECQFITPFLLVLFSLFQIPPLHASDADEFWLSSAGSFKVSFESEVMPIPINQIHYWIVRLETESGEAVTDAVITMDGGMPAHNHGLPTSPGMTESLGDGLYRIEGIRFHMMGDWVIRLTISRGTLTETVSIPLSL